MNTTDRIGLFDFSSLSKSYKDCKPGYFWTFRNVAEVPRADGCSNPLKGAIGKSFASAIPKVPPYSGDPNEPFEGVSFKPACDFHDYCYSNCKMSQEQCDHGLYLRAVKECNKQVLLKAFPTIENRKKWLDDCTKWAKAYYVAVSKAGTSSYDRRQKLACECQCERSLTQSGPVFIDDNGKNYTPIFENEEPLP
jgi:hypothetical protein